MKLFLRVLAIILLILVLTITFARRENSGWIAFSSEEGGESHIFLMTGDGGSVRRIFDGDSIGYYNLKWSPIGSWLLLDISVASSDTVIPYTTLIRPNGEFIQYLPDISSNSTWSPDGRYVARLSYTGLSIVAVDGSSERMLTADLLYSSRWSPNGQWIYGDIPGNYMLHRVSVQTGVVEPLIDLQNGYVRYDLSPDSEQVAVVIDHQESDELIVMNADATEQHTIWTSPQSLSVPKWSPDGAWIAFTDGDVYRIRPDGSDLQRLTQQPLHYHSLDWSPNGEWLTFEAGQLEGSSDIFRMRADGSSLQNLTNGQGNNRSPQYAPRAGLGWHPLGLLIAVEMMLAASFFRMRRR